jgi:hypothetical protein
MDNFILRALLLNQKLSLLKLMPTGYLLAIDYRGPFLRLNFPFISGEELSKKQATQESTIRKLRAQVCRVLILSSYNSLKSFSIRK